MFSILTAEFKLFLPVGLFKTLTEGTSIFSMYWCLLEAVKRGTICKVNSFHEEHLEHHYAPAIFYIIQYTVLLKGYYYNQINLLFFQKKL